MQMTLELVPHLVTVHATLPDLAHVDTATLADLYEARRRRRRGGGIGFLGLLCCLLPIALAIAAIWFAMQRRRTGQGQQPGGYVGPGSDASHGQPGPSGPSQAPPPPAQDGHRGVLPDGDGHASPGGDGDAPRGGGSQPPPPPSS